MANCLDKRYVEIAPEIGTPLAVTHYPVPEDFMENVLIIGGIPTKSRGGRPGALIHNHPGGRQKGFRRKDSDRSLIKEVENLKSIIGEMTIANEIYNLNKNIEEKFIEMKAKRPYDSSLNIHKAKKLIDFNSYDLDENLKTINKKFI